MARTVNHMEKAKAALKQAHEHLSKLDESKGMKKFESKSPAQKKALKGTTGKKRNEIKGGEKANKKLAKKTK